MTKISTDARGRATIGPKDATFKMVQMEDGGILLEPAEFYTRAEIEMLVNDELRENTLRSLRAGRGDSRQRTRR